MWLPGDADHPPRPALPVLYHLTFTEIHALELGSYLGLFIIWAQSLGSGGMALALVALAARRIISQRRAKGGGTTCKHAVGFHDVIAEPHYFGFAVAIIPLLYHLVHLFL